MSAMMAAGSNGQLVGQFLIDRQGVVRWSFTEYAEDGRYMFGAPTPNEEVMSAAAQDRLERADRGSSLQVQRSNPVSPTTRTGPWIASSLRSSQ